MLSAEHRDLMETNFASHAEPPRYNVRGVLLFGGAEIARSAICIDLLEAGRLEQFGELMNISHDGDRVSAPGPDGHYRPLPEDCSDEYLNNLITDLASEDPHRVLRAQLYMQPGTYACSTPQIDLMADIARATPGAGLGGCLMVFAKKDAVPAVEKALIKEYYRPNSLKPAIIPCIPVEGAGLADF
jgi:galactokinase